MLVIVILFWITFGIEMGSFERSKESVTHTQSLAHNDIDVFYIQNAIRY